MADRPIFGVELEVEGFRYDGWKSIRVTRTIEGIAGSFALEVSDKWGPEELWTIVEGSRCRVRIGGVVVIDGYIDKRNPAGSESSRTLGLTGRDRAAALVDNSALLDHWTFCDITIADFASKVAAPFGVKVSVQPGLALPLVKKLVITPGDTAFEALKRATANHGVLIISDGAGGILLTRTSKARATALVEGDNLKAASGEYDATDRYYEYRVLSQTSGTDEANGDATRVLASAFDEGVIRKDRILLIRPDKGLNAAEAKARADWEARVRAAKAEPVSGTVVGWQQPDGTLWPVNATTRVRAPRLAGVDGDMLITQVDYAVDDQGGTITQLRMLRPDAFTPDPAATVKASGGRYNIGAYPELGKQAPAGLLGGLRAAKKKAGL